MKPLAILFGVFALLSAHAQTTNAPPARTEDGLGSQAAVLGKEQQALITLKAPKANEIVADKLTYSGVAVQVAKADKPLQLINPAAPARYGAAEDNVLRDPVHGKISGLKIFAVQF